MRVTQMPATTPTRSNPAQKSSVVFPDEKRRNGIDIGKMLSRFQKDDYILAGIILVLVLEGCDDYVLLAALGYLFVMGL